MSKHSQKKYLTLTTKQIGHIAIKRNSLLTFFLSSEAIAAIIGDIVIFLFVVSIDDSCDIDFFNFSDFYCS